MLYLKKVSVHVDLPTVLVKKCCKKDKKLKNGIDDATKLSKIADHNIIVKY